MRLTVLGRGSYAGADAGRVATARLCHARVALGALAVGPTGGQPAARLVGEAERRPAGGRPADTSADGPDRVREPGAVPGAAEAGAGFRVLALAGNALLIAAAAEARAAEKARSGAGGWRFLLFLVLLALGGRRHRRESQTQQANGHGAARAGGDTGELIELIRVHRQPRRHTPLPNLILIVEASQACAIREIRHLQAEYSGNDND